MSSSISPTARRCAFTACRRVSQVASGIVIMLTPTHASKIPQFMPSWFLVEKIMVLTAWSVSHLFKRARADVGRGKVGKEKNCGNVEMLKNVRGDSDLPG